MIQEGAPRPPEGRPPWFWPPPSHVRTAGAQVRAGLRSLASSPGYLRPARCRAFPCVPTHPPRSAGTFRRRPLQRGLPGLQS